MAGALSADSCNRPYDMKRGLLCQNVDRGPNRVGVEHLSLAKGQQANGMSTPRNPRGSESSKVVRCCPSTVGKLSTREGTKGTQMYSV